MSLLFGKFTQIFCWVIVTEVFYFVSFSLEYVAYRAVNNKRIIDAIRYSIEFTQLAIIIWGLIVVNFIQPDAQEQLKAIRKRSVYNLNNHI